MPGLSDAARRLAESSSSSARAPASRKGAMAAQAAWMSPEEEQPGGLVGEHRHRVHHRLGDEGQGALGADEEVGEDVHRPLEVEERVQLVAGGVLHPVLRPDALHQRRPRAHLVAQREETLVQRRLARPELARPRPRRRCRCASPRAARRSASGGCGSRSARRRSTSRCCCWRGCRPGCRSGCSPDPGQSSCRRAGAAGSGGRRWSRGAPGSADLPPRPEPPASAAPPRPAARRTAIGPRGWFRPRGR